MKKIFPILLFTSFLLCNTKTVAISYFDNTSGIEQYNPLSKGLADMLITDLSNVKSIQIVEREKLESLLKEIELGDSKFIDKSTAQKLGEGLGAGYILTGSFLIMDETLRIDARLVDVGTGEVKMAEEITGEKNMFFTLEKDMVNKLVASLNLDLTKSEARKVKKVQTESFEAFSNYSSSLDAYDKGEYEESIQFLGKATENDEDFDIAWDKLEELQEKLNKLVKERSKNLTEKIIKSIDNMFKTQNDADVEMMNKMLATKRDEITKLLLIVNRNPNEIAGTSVDSLNYLSENFMNALDDTMLKTVDDLKGSVIKKLDQWVLAKQYLDSKGFEPNLATRINPFKMSWMWTLAMAERYIELIIRLEAWHGPDRLTIKNLHGIEKLAYQILDEFIIDHGNKLLNEYPYENDERNKIYVERAILRKENPDIYTAYKWIYRNKDDSSLEMFPDKLFFLNEKYEIISNISKEALNGILLIPCYIPNPPYLSSKTGGIKELHFNYLYKDQLKLMEENLSGIKIDVYRLMGR